MKNRSGVKKETRKRILSVRISDEQATDLDALAFFDGVSVAEQMRRAIDLLLDERRADPAFRERVEAAVSRAQKLLTELGESDVARALTPTRNSEEVS